MANKKKEQIILDIEADLRKLISYDEWTAHEHVEEKIDIYDTAVNLYNAGYRKVRKDNNKNGKQKRACKTGN